MQETRNNYFWSNKRNAIFRQVINSQHKCRKITATYLFCSTFAYLFSLEEVYLPETIVMSFFHLILKFSSISFQNVSLWCFLLYLCCLYCLNLSYTTKIGSMIFVCLMLEIKLALKCQLTEAELSKPFLKFTFFHEIERNLEGMKVSIVLQI